MRCKDIMKTDVEWLSETDTIQTAARKMRNLNVGFLPVCDRDKHVLGTLTDRDIAIRVCADDRPASAIKAIDLMTQEVVACRPEDDLTLVERLMAQYHKSRILIVDTNGALCGVISLSDLAEREDSQRVAKTLRAVAAREVRA